MPKTHVSRLIATGAASAALAVGGLAATTTPANAAGSASAVYTCDNGVGAIPVSFTMPNLPTTALAGVPLPALPVSISMPVSADRVTISDLLVGVGFGDVPVSLAGAPGAVSGVIGSINPGLAGPIPVVFPKAFTMALTQGKTTTTSTCSQSAEPPAGTIQVSQQTASMKAVPASKKVKASKNGEVKVDVSRQVGAPTGKVYAIWKGKTIGQVKLKRTGGQVVLKLAKLAPGSYKIKVKYEGDPATTAVSQNVNVTVVR